MSSTLPHKFSYILVANIIIISFQDTFVAKDDDNNEGGKT